MKKILITGGAGLIGSALNKELVGQGYGVVSCDIRFNDNPLSFFSQEIKPLLAQCSGIIHLAAISRVIHGEEHPELCQEVNVDGTIKLLEFYKDLPHKPWFIYGSSREVYGQQETLPVSENAPLKPVNNYARGKVLIEQQVSGLREFGFNTAILRFSNVYGGMLDHYDRVIPAFCLKALRGEQIRIEGKECVFDFTHLEDVVGGIALAVGVLQKGAPLESAIHFTGGRGCNLEELANMILKITESNSQINYYPARNFDVGRFYGDYSMATKLLGWRPQYSLEEGLHKFIYDIQHHSVNCPYNVGMRVYENIESYSWLPTILQCGIRNIHSDALAETGR
ncbi:MAG: epimerase [Rickettsiales bacterium]|nr:MAG: epimerase [Rickettsiales bacterium]